MINKSELFKLAHTQTRKLRKQFPNINYHVQFGLMVKELIKFYKMNTLEKVQYNFNVIANSFEVAETKMELKNWKDKRVYVNFKHGKYSTFIYIDRFNKQIYCPDVTNIQAYTHAKIKAVRIIEKYKSEILNLGLELEAIY